MSEKLPKKPESDTDHSTEHKTIKLKSTEKPNIKSEHERKLELDTLHRKVELHAASKEDLQTKPSERAQEESPTILTKDLQKLAFQRSITQVRRHLSKTERSFSKVVHQPVIEKVSDITSKTIARPYGIIGGALCMFIGSAFLLFISKRYGFTYNYMTGLLLLVGGYSIGCIFELVARLIIKSKGRD